MDAFMILGLEPTATPAQVKTAYRRLAAECHPDKGGTPEQFTRLNLAYVAAFEEASRPAPCPECGGLGSKTEVRGWTSMSTTCQRCSGTGIAEKET